jgi:catechol 2,3-dioxygenase-like lactoylglutathione lyase family enzyme
MRVLAFAGALVALTVAVSEQLTGAQQTSPATWSAPLTPWDDPDLEGIWDSKTVTPLQRPDRFIGREFLTDEEVAAIEKEAAEHPGEAQRAEAEAEAIASGTTPYMEDVVGSCLVPFNYPGTRVVRTKRTSLIVNPPDGRIPFIDQNKPKPIAPPARSKPVKPPLDNSGPSNDPEDRPAKNQIYETACHDGNYSMTTTLSGARALDKSASTALSSGGRPVRVQPAHFHHLHLNSLDPRAAIEYYARAFSTVTKTRLAGFDGFTTTSRMSSGQGNVVVLISKTDTPPAIKPQSAISHFGWNVPDSRAYLDKFHALKLRVVPMYADADGTLVENSSDALPGYLTKAQIVDVRSKGTKAVRKGGFHYLEGPDGALIESYGDFPAERFTHIHMYHSDPVCAQQWYARHLGATVAATHLHLGPGGPSGSGAGAQDCRRRFAEPTYPAFGPQGRVREPSGYILFDDVGLPMWPYDGPLTTTRRQTVDHIGLSVADLAATLARLRAEGVKVIEQTYQWGNTRAAMIEGPDHVALELIEGN